MEYCTSLKVQACLRFLCIALLVSSACTVGLDAQSKPILGDIEKKATVNDLPTLRALVIVNSVAAGYNLLQLSVNLIRIRFEKKKASGFNKATAWSSFLLDQMVAYAILATNSAAAQVSILAITGVSEFQWLKLCSIYTKFCIQVGGGIFCGTVACFSMVLISSISAFNLFRFYSWTNFLALKPR